MLRLEDSDDDNFDCISPAECESKKGYFVSEFYCEKKQCGIGLCVFEL